MSTKNQFVVIRQQLISYRNALLQQDPTCFRGNTKIRQDYADRLDSRGIPQAQKEIMLGMVLSDASVTYGTSGQARVRMQQQNIKNAPWINYIVTMLDEYFVNNQTLNPVSATRTNMSELTTVSCKSIGSYFSGMIEAGENRVKLIQDPARLAQDLGPLAFANWICGDGTRADHGANKGKQIELSTQGFTKKDTAILAEIISTNFGVNAVSQLDYVGNDQVEHYRIRISGKNFDQLGTLLAPYMPRGMAFRLPEGRKRETHFGNLTEPKLQALFGTAVTDVNQLIDTYQ